MSVSCDGWRKNKYDGTDEFLVLVKEQNKREQQSSQEEIHRKIGKASTYTKPLWSYFQNHFKKERKTNQATNIYIYIYIFTICIAFPRIDSQADKDPEINAQAFEGVESMQARLQAEKDAPESSCPPGNSQEQEAWGSKCVALESFPIPQFDFFILYIDMYNFHMKYFHRMHK